MVLQREVFLARVRDSVTAPITNIAPGDLETESDFPSYPEKPSLHPDPDTEDRLTLSELSPWRDS